MSRQDDGRIEQDNAANPAGGRGLAKRLGRFPLGHRLLGLLAARRFSKHGWISCVPGLPLLRVRNLGGSIEAGNCLFYPGVRLEVGQGARLSIGTGTYINRNTEVIAWKEVSIGQGCMIGWDVLIMDTDQHPLPGKPLVNHPVRIGDYVWIGARATILKGVTIGNGAIVGACAVVTRDVPSGAIVTGQPATIRPARS